MDNAVFNRLEKNVEIIMEHYKTDPVIPPPPPPLPPVADLDKQSSYRPPVVVEDASEEDYTAYDRDCGAHT